MHYELSWDDYTISTDPARLDYAVIHGFLNKCYWSPGISYGQVQRQCRHSLCFGLYRGRAQIGLARVNSDFTRFAYISDLFVIAEFQGQGLGQRLMEAVLNHSDLRDVVVWTLATKDAHGLYKRYGFKLLMDTTSWMGRKLDQPRRWV
jgi:GNAT superfamily N-acetyltransferase